MARAPDERMVTIPAAESEEVLEGIYLGRPGEERGAVIAPPHPLYGGSMDSPVASELAYSCSRAGIAALRFNWRGVGASAGLASGEGADADADYDAALAQMAHTVGGPLLACGYSFGAAAALRAGGRHPRVERLVLVAPPPSLLSPGALAGLERPVLILTGSADTLAPAAALEALCAEAPGVRLEVVPEADHFFGVGLGHLGRVSYEWLSAGAA